jgi:hypothetical protein
VKLRSLIVVSCAVIGGVANAAIDMDHINVISGTLADMPTFGVMQIAADYPFSGMVVDDFNASGNIVQSVSVAFDLGFTAFDFNQVRGWQISFFKSVADAAGSGFFLNGNTVAQTFQTSAIINPLAGTGAVSQAYVATFNNLNLDLGSTGHYWVGVSVDAPFGNNGQMFILQNSWPVILGAGTANDAVGIDPLGTFGQGNPIPLQNNAAYQVVTDCVPEPATLAAVGAGLLGFLRRRRS